MDNSFAEDDYNFTLKFKQAWAPYSNTMSTGRGSIISKAAFEEMGETDFARAPIGSGPYKIVEWNPGTQIKLTRNEYYHGEPAKTENIIIKFISEPTAMWTASWKTASWWIPPLPWSPPTMLSRPMAQARRSPR